MQIGDVVREMKSAFHIVGDDNARHPKAFLEPADQAVDAVRHDRIETGRRFIVDRKSTRLNSSHDQISYAVFCLKKKNRQTVFSPAPMSKLLAPMHDNTS